MQADREGKCDMARMDEPSIGELLKSYRTARNMTQVELAEKTGSVVSIRAIGNIERGLTRPQKGTIRLLSQALNLSDAERDALLEARKRPTKIVRISLGETVSPLQISAYLRTAFDHARAGEFAQAAIFYDRYASLREMTWEQQFWRGSAHANARQGRTSDLAALDAYTKAINRFSGNGAGEQGGQDKHPAPRDEFKGERVRLFVLRGGIYKRLGYRGDDGGKYLDMAEADLKAAREDPLGFDINDINYNLTCVYAMKPDREQLFATLRYLRNSPTQLREIASHLGDYFNAYADDEEFLSVIRPALETIRKYFR